MSKYYNRQWRLPNNENKDKQSNYSMDFDGSSYIDLGSSLDLGTVNTTSVWFKLDNTSGGVITGENSYNYLYNMYLTSTYLYYQIGAGNFYQMTLSLSLNQWYHFVFVRNGINVTLYIDSVSQGTQNTSATVNTKFQAIGAKPNGTAGFLGQIDGLCVFNYALSSSQVTTLYGSSSTGIGNPMTLNPKPVAYYPLGDQDSFNGSDYLVPNSSLKDFVFNQNGNQLVTITGNSTTQPTGDYSLSIWVKIVGSATYSGILNATTNNNANGVGFLYNYSTGKFQFYQGAFANDLIFTGSTNTWQNIIISYNNTTGDLIAYLNGQQADSNTITPSGVSWVVDWQLNNYRQSSSPLYGQNEFSNFQIFDTALSASDAETLYNNGSPLTSMSGFSSLQGWWKLDASATYNSSTTTWTIPDDSSNSNDGTSSGMTQANLVQSDLSFTSGYSPYALEFDGTNDYIDCGNDSTLKITSNFSISAWMKSSNQKSFAVAVGNNGVFSLQMSATLNKFRFNVYSGGWISATYALNPIDDGKWHHVVATHDGSTIKIYVDNIKGTDASAGTIASNTEPFLIGYLPGNAGLYFNGQISNVSYWNTALTQTQVSEIYSEGVPQNLLNHSAVSSLVSWWQLGSNSSFSTNWTVLDEKGTNNGTSVNMTEDDIVDGVGSYANGLSSGMGGDEVIGDAPYSTSNSLSVNMDVEDRVSDTPS